MSKRLHYLPKSTEFDTLPLRWHIYNRLAARYTRLQRGRMWDWSVRLYVEAHERHLRATGRKVDG